MKSHTFSTHTPFVAWLLWGGCLVIAGVLWLAPGLLYQLRPWLLDLAGWGLTGMQQASVSGESDLKHSEQALRIATLEQSNRRLELHAADLQERLTELKSRIAAPLGVIDTPQLVVHQPHAARVLGHLGIPGHTEHRLVLNLGGQSGIRGDELVIRSELPVIDQGATTGVQPDDLLLVGQTLWGRVVDAGRWTSTVQPVTDPNFRTAVRLVRSSPQGPVFGARGVLHGDGAHCLLEQLSASEPVSLGDHVYTDSEVASPVPLYCGIVIAADVQPNDTFWTIKVLPAATPAPQELVVLEPQLNPQRLALDVDAGAILR